MIWLLFQYLLGAASRFASRPTYPLAAGQETRLPPEPRLQTDPRGDLRELRAHEDAVLSTYGWVDKAAGVVRIPIDEAMRITAQRGLPARSASWGRTEVTRPRPFNRAETRSGSTRSAVCVAIAAGSALRRPVDAQMIGAPAAGYKREAGMPVVRDAGGAARDRLRSEHRPAAPARHPVRRRTGPRGAARQLLRRAAGRPRRSCTTSARCSARRC